MHTSPSGKVYVGITKDTAHRWRANGNGYKGSTRIWYAIQKYGWDNFKHEILKDGLTLREASELEKETIARYKSTDPLFGYNLTSGGYDGIQCEESKKKKSESLMGHAVSESVRKRLSDCRSIEIICLETSVTYKNAIDASLQTGICATSIGKVCNGKASIAGGYHFAKVSDFEAGTIPQFKPRSNDKAVVCIETGEVFKSQIEAAKSCGVSSQAISHCCTGKTKTCASMHWRFLENN